MGRVLRRQFLIATGALLAPPLTSFAQQLGKVWRIGWLMPGSTAIQAIRSEALRAGLREIGYVEGKNFVIESRFAEGNPERLPALAAELVGLKVDLILAAGVPAVVAARGATRTIPIVMAAGADLVALGLAASLARPGGNVTGQTSFVEAFNAKGLGLLKEAIPNLTRVAVLLPPDNPATKLAMATLIATAKDLKLEIPAFTVQGGTDFEGAFAAMIKQRVGAVLISVNALLDSNAKSSADLALKHRLPSYGIVDFAEAGGMLGYGVNFAEMYRRSAVFIDKIFKGAKPGDIPIEQATKFDFVVNMKTAKRLGIKIPASIRVQATKVIE